MIQRTSMVQARRAARTGRLGIRIGASVPIMIGVIVMIGWWQDLPLLKSGIPGYVSMKPNTAAALMLAGVALWLLGPENRSFVRTRIGLCGAAMCGMIGVLTLLAYMGGPSWLNIDLLLFKASQDVGRSTLPGRMAATSAAGFVGVAIALLLLDARVHWKRSLGTIALTSAAAIPLGVLVGYLYQVIPVGGAGQPLQMALHTAAGFLSLAGGIIASRPRRGFARLLYSPGPGGVLARRLLPLALGAPIGLGLLRLGAESSRALDPSAVDAAATVATMFLLAWVTWRTAVVMDKSNAARLGAEQASALRNAELQVANTRLVAAQELAEAASLAKSRFLSNMSHELRTPLNSVLGFVGVLIRNRNGRFTPTDLDYLGRIQRNGQHLLTLINDILDIARVEAGKITVVLELVPLDRLLGDILMELQGRSIQGAVPMRAEIPPGLAPLRTDALKLKQIIINLLANALKFTSTGEVVVRVATWPDGRRAMRIDVIDSGIGIPEDRLEAIFGAFEQAEVNTSQQYGGTGLGLSISRAFAQALGYRIVVRSTSGVGSVFSVLLDADAILPNAPGER